MVKLSKKYSSKGKRVLMKWWRHVTAILEGFADVKMRYIL